jgi:hypothetical protein
MSNTAPSTMAPPPPSAATDNAYSLDIPIREFARNVMLRTEGKSLKDDCLYLTESNLAGKALICYQAELGFPLTLPQLPGAVLKLQLSQRLFYQFYRWNDADGLLVLSSFYEKTAMRILFSWLDAGIAFSKSKQQAIDFAYTHFEIDEWMLPQENILQLHKYHHHKQV